MIHAYILALVIGSFCTNAAQYTPQQLQGIHSALNAALVGGASSISDQESPFEKVHEDVYCNDGAPFQPPFFSGNVKTVRDCKLKCINDPRCAYMAYWLKTKKCETYFTCFSQTRDGNNKILVFKRVSICEQERDKYYNLMAKEFPRNFIRPLYMPFEWEKNAGPRSNHRQPNIHCKCTGMSWLTCGIFATEETPEFELFNDRFDPNYKEKMKPFFVLSNGLSKYGGEKKFLAFAEQKQGLTLFAELQLFEFVPNGRTKTFRQSNPGCIHMRQCVDGTPGGICPVQARPFESGEPVYIMRHDSKFVGTTQRLVCISVKGLRSHLMEEECLKDGGFRDPLGRQPMTQDGPVDILTIDEFYYMFFLFDDAAMGTGICSPQSHTPTKAPTTVGYGEQLRKALEHVTLEEGGSGGEEVSPPAPGAAVRKSRSKSSKKKKKKSGSSQSERSSPLSPQLTATSPIDDADLSDWRYVGIARPSEAGPSTIAGPSTPVQSPELRATSPRSGEAGPSGLSSDVEYVPNYVFGHTPNPGSDVEDPPYHSDSNAGSPESAPLPSILQAVSPTSPTLIMPQVGSPDKPKLVLPDADLAKLRRSFEEAKARRGRKKSGEDHVSSSLPSNEGTTFIFCSILLLGLLFLSQHHYTPSHENVYLEFST